MPAIEAVDVSVYEVPTDAPESDGTLEWRATTCVVVQIRAGGVTGLGYTYASRAAATLIHEKLADVVVGADAMDVSALWAAMRRVVRNVGREGIAATAISAVDIALWDLKARLVGLPLVTLLGQVRESVPVYGSGGFTSYGVDRLAEQLGGWVADGMTMVKMKVGRGADVERVAAARRVIGDAGLMVDANGAWTAKTALGMAERFAEQGVSWFEEPVSSDDVEGLRLLRERGPVGMAIAAGEYVWDLVGARRLMGAVDVLQADVTRAMGITGFMKIAAICEAWGVGLSAHTAPAASLAVGCAVEGVVHLEWFHDHVRVEGVLFEGVVGVEGGRVRADPSRVGMGIGLKTGLERWRV